MRVLGASGVSESQTMNWNIAPITDLCIYGTLCFQMSSFHFETNYFTLFDIEEKNCLTLTRFLEKMWWMGECQKIFNEPQNLKRHLFIRQKMQNIIVWPTGYQTCLGFFPPPPHSPFLAYTICFNRVFRKKHNDNANDDYNMMKDKLEVGRVCCHILTGAIVKYVKRAARSDDDDDDSAKTVIILLLKGKPSFVKKKIFCEITS